MSSQVKSQITDKVYEATLDDLYELDQGLEVDLYKINVFNKDIMIAPGKVISDTKKDVHYCYVYVIKNGRVAAKLGIYETHSKKDEVYDLTDFEGREFLLFDHYYNEPGVLVEYEMKEEVQTDNIFDYLKRYLKPVTNATAAIKEQATVIRKISKRMEGNPLATHLKNFKRQKPYDESWLDSFKEDAENWIFNLLVLEVVFNIKFIFENSDGSEDDMREMIRSTPNESTTIIRVSLEDMPRYVANKPLYVSAAVEEEFVQDTFPSPTEPIEAKPTIKPPPSKAPSKAREESPEAKPLSKASAEAKPASKAREESPEAKPAKSFTSKASKASAESPEAKPLSKAREESPEAKPAKSFTSKASKASAEVEPRPEAKPVKSFSSKESKPSAEPTPEAKPASKASAEDVPEPRTESPPRPPPSVRKGVSPAQRSVSPAQRSVSPVQRSVSPAQISVSPVQRSVSPAQRAASPEGPPKPKRISFSAPVKKLKNAVP